MFFGLPERPQVLLASTIIVLFFATYHYLWRPYRRLSHFPGPRSAALSRLFSVKALLSGREHELMFEAHKKYGPVVRWQPNLLIVNNPELLHEIYFTRAEKTPHYNASLENVESLVEAKGWETHRNARRRISEPFSLESVRTDEPLIDESIQSWIDDLDSMFAKTGNVFDLTNWPALAMAHISMIRLMGFDYSHIPGGDATAFEFMKTFRSTLKIVHVLARLAPIKEFILRGPMKKLLPRAGDGSAVGRVFMLRDKLMASTIDKVEGEKNNHLMYYLLHKARNSDGTRMSEAEIHDDVNGFLLNAHETSGHTLLSAILQITKNPSILERLTAEIKQTLDEHDSNKPVSYEKIATLPYLKACIREALRFDPAGVSYLPRYVKPGGLELPDDQGFVPDKTEIGASPWVIGRSKELYGADADVYRPERFLEDLAWADHVSKYDLAWGSGRRRCLGKTLALFGMYKILFQFFANFRVEVVEPAKSEVYMFWVHRDLKVRIRRAEK